MIALADCAVVVTDAKESARWWNEKLGFGVHTVGNGEHAVMVAPPGDRFVLHLCAGIESVSPGNTGIAFMTDDIEALVERMRAGGVEFPEPLKRQSWGAMAKFADPDGNIYWLLEAPAAFVRREANRKAPSRTRSQPKISSKTRQSPRRTHSSATRPSRKR